MVGISAGEAGVADDKENPFTLIYDGAITKNEAGKVNILCWRCRAVQSRYEFTHDCAARLGVKFDMNR